MEKTSEPLKIDALNQAMAELDRRIDKKQREIHNLVSARAALKQVAGARTYDGMLLRKLVDAIFCAIKIGEGRYTNKEVIAWCRENYDRRVVAESVRSMVSHRCKKGLIKKNPITKELSLVEED